LKKMALIFISLPEQIAKQEEAKKLFAHLAQAEAAHKKTLKESSRKWKIQSAESYAGEYSAYFALLC